MAEHQHDTELFYVQEPQLADQLPDVYVSAKETERVLTPRGPLELPIKAEEYYSRTRADYVDEFRATITAGAQARLDFTRVVKYVEITCPLASAGDLYVNFNGGDAGNGDGNIQVRAGETRGFTIPTQFLSLTTQDATHAATYRVTIQW